MTKEQAESLYPIVNSVAFNALLEHKLAELQKCHADLEWQTSDAAVRTQGRIQEIRRDLDLRNRVNVLLGGN